MIKSYYKYLTIFTMILILSCNANAATITYDFENYTVGDQFTGISNLFTVQTLAGDPLRIEDKSGSFSPALPGLGGNTLRTYLPTRDFEFIFDNSIDYFEMYVLDGEEPLEVRTDTGLIASDVTVGSGPGGPVRLITVGAIGGSDLFSRVIVDDLCACGPGPFDLVTFNVVSIPSAVPVPAAVWLFGSGLIGLIGFARRKSRA